MICHNHLYNQQYILRVPTEAVMPRVITDLSSADFARLDVVILVPGQQAAGAESQPSQDCHQRRLLLLYGLATTDSSHYQLLKTCCDQI